MYQVRTTTSDSVNSDVCNEPVVQYVSIWFIAGLNRVPMETLNFCHPCFQPHIYSDKVSVDGHEVTNLISADARQQTKGFLAEYFIRVPVSVTLQFPFNIEIDHIMIDGTVGAQTSSSFEIFTHSELRHLNTFSGCWIKQGTSMPCKDFDDKIFSSVGKIWRNDNESSSVVCFNNPRFRVKPPFSMLRAMPSRFSGRHCESRPLHHHLSRQLTSVTYLTIRITRTARGCIPGLKSLEVWGQPSFSCSKDEIKHIISLYESFMSPQVVSVEGDQKSQQEASTLVPSSNAAACDPSVPAEFFDPITCDIMALPMLLPSGHTVDQSTLDKHNDAEAKWGHKPSDPFTGVTFSKNSKPVPNAALKVRIDNFLLTDGANLTVARTTGRHPATDQSLASSSGQVSVLTKDLQTQKQLSPSDKPQPCTSHSPTPGPASSREHLDKDQGQIISSYNDIPDSGLSLDDALDMILGDLPTFQTKTAENNTQKLKEEMSDLSLPHDSIFLNTDRKPGFRSRPKATNPNAGCSSLKSRRKRKHSPTPSVPVTVIDLTQEPDLTDESSAVKTSSLRRPSQVHMSHGELLSRSLDIALENTLGSLPSFQAPKPSVLEDSNNEDRQCTFCWKVTDIGNLYHLPCSHRACRPCIGLRKRSGKITCDNCQVEVQTKDIVKLHL